MTKHPTRAQQVKEVVQGLALGVLAVGVTAVSSGKLDLEFALGHALRRWSYADRFPSLAGQLGPNYLWIGLRRSGRWQQTHAAWSDGRWMTPYIRMDNWSVDDCFEILVEFGQVPREGWIQLAELFVEHLGSTRARRS